MDELIRYVGEQTSTATTIPEFRAGDNVTVNLRIREGEKERIQAFKGDIIQISGTGSTKTFTIRKMSGNFGVERIIPFNSPAIAGVVVNKRGKVRRSRLFYLRDRVGKKARIKENKAAKR